MIWKSFFVYYILGRSQYLYRSSREEELILANFNTIKSPTGTLNLKSKLQFSESPYFIVFGVKVFSAAWKNCPVDRHQREVHFGALVMSEMNMELVQ